MERTGGPGPGMGGRPMEYMAPQGAGQNDKDWPGPNWARLGMAGLLCRQWSGRSGEDGQPAGGVVLPGNLGKMTR